MIKNCGMDDPTNDISSTIRKINAQSSTVALSSARNNIYTWSNFEDTESF